MQQEPRKWLIPVLLSALVLGILFFFWTQLNKTTKAPVVEAPAVTEPVVDDQATYPVAEETIIESAPRPLPELDKSDAEIAGAIVGLFANKDVGSHLASDNIIVRLVTTVDNLTHPRIAERLRPVVGLDGQFMVDPVWSEDEDANEFTLSPANYARYDWLISQLNSVDSEQLAATYQHYNPLFQQAYTDLGYPDSYFNDRLIEVIDHLLATPRVGEPVKLIRPHVLYQFADPRLEGLSSGQKILIRMGNQHATVVKTKLRELRGLLTK